MVRAKSAVDTVVENCACGMTKYKVLIYVVVQFYPLCNFFSFVLQVW